jgi:hypothetical protein
VIVLPAGSDWTECRNSAGRTNAIERLNRLRELFYGEPNRWARASCADAPVDEPAFRSYAENAHWTVGKVLYATINLPANNNHYLPEAGRNSEYEDRAGGQPLLAEPPVRAWPRRDKLDAIVLFSEGDLKALAEPTGTARLLRRARRTTTASRARRQMQALAQKFPARCCWSTARRWPKGAKPAIEWRGNLGHVSVGAERSK